MGLQHAIYTAPATGKMLFYHARILRFKSGPSALSRVSVYQSIGKMIEWPIHRVCSPLPLKDAKDNVKPFGHLNHYISDTSFNFDLTSRASRNSVLSTPFTLSSMVGNSEISLAVSPWRWKSQKIA